MKTPIDDIYLWRLAGALNEQEGASLQTFFRPSTRPVLQTPEGENAPCQRAFLALPSHPHGVWRNVNAEGRILFVNQTFSNTA